MNKSVVNYYRIMRKNAAVLAVVCLMLCLSFNYTFPLHRETTKGNPLGNYTFSNEIEKQEHSDSIVDRTKKMAANIEQALKKIIDLTPDKEKIERETKCSQNAHAKHVARDNDLSNFEQLVIMKKYPFLDLQELDFNYHLLPKNKQSLNSGPVLAPDPSFCESSDDAPNVEITNRGLSGFAIPTTKVKTGNANDPSHKEKNNQESEISNRRLDDLRILENLEEDIKNFVKHLD